MGAVLEPGPVPPGVRAGRVWFAHAIRGPACLLVVFGHLFDLFPTAQPLVAQIGRFEPVAGLPQVPWAGVLRFLGRQGISTGTVGVLLFFLVSGFVIPFSLERGTPRGFILRRFFRLYPTLWACLLVTLVVLAVQARAQGASLPYGGRAVGANVLLVAPYTSQPWVEPVLWSLALEELFYVIAATLAWRRLLASPWALLAAGAGLAGIALTAKGATPLGPLFWLGFNATYVIVILLGVVAHHLYQRAWSAVRGLATASALLVLHVAATYGGPATGVGRIYLRCMAVAIVVFGALFLARDRLPYWRWLDGLSNVSYPLYLIHGVNGYIVLRAAYLLTDSYYVAAVATVAVALGAAWALHRWVEVPTNAFGRRLSRRRAAPEAVPVP